jgi:hypothetical protein
LPEEGSNFFSRKCQAAIPTLNPAGSLNDPRLQQKVRSIPEVESNGQEEGAAKCCGCSHTSGANRSGAFVLVALVLHRRGRTNRVDEDSNLAVSYLFRLSLADGLDTSVV